jgi:predicted GIY-YIG superfamily endonuclease
MPERTALYRLYDTRGRLLYVGITNNPEVRWQTHAREKPWWPKVANKTLEWFETRKSAQRVERIEIAEERPAFNLQHNPGRARELYNENNARKRLAGTVVPQRPRRPAAEKPRRVPLGWTRHYGFHPEHPDNC